VLLTSPAIRGWAFCFWRQTVSFIVKMFATGVGTTCHSLKD
jgi:hypothetical protein